MSLFAALVPPPDAVRDLAGELAGELARHRRPAAHGVRWTSEASWHLTLAFYGNDPAHGDDGARGRAGWLAPRLTGRAPVRLGLAGAG
ncbi:MAG: 2'-5' RNA ligase family protein, partial [Thermocrispum sp.]